MLTVQLVGRHVQRKGWRSQRFQWAMKPSTLRFCAEGEAKSPRTRMRRWRIENQISTWFIHEACLGV